MGITKSTCPRPDPQLDRYEFIYNKAGGWRIFDVWDSYTEVVSFKGSLTKEEVKMAFEGFMVGLKRGYDTGLIDGRKQKLKEIKEILELD